MTKLQETLVEDLAFEIRQLLLKHNMWIDVRIYFNGKAMSTDNGRGKYAYNDKSQFFILEDQNPRLYTRYAGDILTMTFEGPFYDVLNYFEDPEVYEEFVELLRKYELYHELGEAWNLTVCPLPKKEGTVWDA